MSWLGIIPPVLVVSAILFLPGLVLGLALRQRGLRLLAIAPVLSVSLVAVAALGAPVVGLTWGVLPLVVLTILAGVCGWFWSRYAGRASAAVARPRRWGDIARVALAVVIPGVILTVILVRSMHEPDFFSQRYDNFFHLNAVQYVLDTGSASPLWLGSMTSQEGIPFYPSAWHAIAALLVSLTGASVAVASNAMIIVIAAIVWPLGLVFLLRTLLGRGAIVTVVGGVLGAAFPAFPLLPLHYGVLYPLFLGLAMVPPSLAMIWMLLRPGRVVRRQDWALVIVLAVPGVSVAHPGALMALIALSVPFVISRLIVAISGAKTVRSRIVSIALLVGYLAAGVLFLRIVRPPGSQIYWPVIQTVSGAIGEVVSAAVYMYPPVYGVGALLVIGAYSAVRRGGYVRWAVLAMAVVGSSLYIVVASSPHEVLRNWFTAPWYNNSPRLASIWVIAVIPLAVLGARTLLFWFVRRVRPLRLASRGVRIGLAAVAVTILVLATQGPAMRQAAADIEFTYQLREGGPILSPDEMALLEDLDELVPDDAVIAGDPWTGASFAYGVSGRKVLMPHLLMDTTEDAMVINTKFSTAGDSPEVCEALANTGVRYILDFSAGGDFQENPDDYSGLDNLDRSPFVSLVEEQGDAKLYEITSCGVNG